MTPNPFMEYSTLSMNLPQQLYQLEQIDTALEDNISELKRAESEMRNTAALTNAELRWERKQKQLKQVVEKLRAAEWEMEDIRARLSREVEKLYGGKVRNPKELRGLEQEVELLKPKLRESEDKLLDLMANAEEARGEAKQGEDEFELAKRELSERRERLEGEAVRLKTEAHALNKEREESSCGLSAEVLELYQTLRKGKGRAVAKVERGRCLGCNVALPTSQLAKLNTDELVQCSNCYRILCLL